MAYALLFAIPFTASAQTTWVVEVGGSTLTPPAPYYDPQFITIEVGDIVHWDCVTGKHNVYAELDSFPANPEGFTSGAPANSPWDYFRTFTVPGFYEYHCVQEGHAATQFGTITVLDANGILPAPKISAITIYPVPVEDMLVLSLNGCTGAIRASVISVDGRTLRTQAVRDSDRNIIDLNGLPTGQYFLYVDRGIRSRVLPFVKR